MSKITPFLWFDSNAEEAVNYYLALFDESKILYTVPYPEGGETPKGSNPGDPMMVDFTLATQSFTAINGGDYCKLNQSITLYVYCNSELEIETLYKKLSEGGKIFFPLAGYHWSEKYAWIQDKFGISWQLDISTNQGTQKIVPAILFVNNNMLKVKEAVEYYTSIFPDSAINFERPYEKNHGLPDGTLIFAQFQLANYTFNLMSGPGKHEFDLNEAFSFVVSCKNQEEVDRYWNLLTADGGKEGRCSWLTDKFGVSWQIVPDRLIELLNQPDTVKAQAVMNEMLKMNKIIISDLENAIK